MAKVTKAKIKLIETAVDESDGDFDALVARCVEETGLTREQVMAVLVDG